MDNMNIHKKNCLFLTFQGISKGDGVSKKVFAQKNAFIELGLDTTIVYPIFNDDQIIFHKEEDLFHSISFQNYNEGYKQLYNKIFDFIH